MRLKKQKIVEYFLMLFLGDIKCSSFKNFTSMKRATIQMSWLQFSLSNFLIFWHMTSKYPGFNLKNNLKRHQMLNLKLQISNNVVLKVTLILEENSWKITLNMSKLLRKIVCWKISGWEIFNKYRNSNRKKNLLSWLKNLFKRDFLKDFTILKMLSQVLPN